MATNKKPIFLNSVISKNVEIDNAAGTASSAVFTAGADGGVAVNLTATSTDTSAVICVLTINDGSQTNIIGEVSIPAGAGTDGTTAAVNILDDTAMPGRFQNDGSLIVGANAVLLVAAKSAVTATKTLNVSMSGGSYSA